MTINFSKYQGTGNDFVIIDNRNRLFPKENLKLVSKLCDRKFGIGSDGLILIEKHDEFDFELVYFNADGSKSFCGNGSRCGVAFAKKIGLINSSTTFHAIDGVHHAKMNDQVVHLKMNDVNEVETINDNYFLDTGSPHYIVFNDNIKDMDIIKDAHSIRYNDRFKEKGTNVNFVETNNHTISIRTYERGVEDETLSCGTGATAVGISSYLHHNIKPPIKINVEGGELTIDFNIVDNEHFNNIWLIGPATHVFDGTIDL